MRWNWMKFASTPRIFGSLQFGCAMVNWWQASCAATSCKQAKTYTSNRTYSIENLSIAFVCIRQKRRVLTKAKAIQWVLNWILANAVSMEMSMVFVSLHPACSSQILCQTISRELLHFLNEIQYKRYSIYTKPLALYLFPYLIVRSNRAYTHITKVENNLIRQSFELDTKPNRRATAAYQVAKVACSRFACALLQFCRHHLFKCAGYPTILRTDFRNDALPL